MSRPARGTDAKPIIQPVFAIRDAQPQLKQTIDSILTAANRQLTAYGGIAVADTIVVLVATRREQFDSAVGGRFPDWGVGCAIPELNTMIILSPFLYPYQIELAEVLRHELAHLYLHRLAGWSRLPRWMDEGFAMLIGHQWRFGDDWQVGRAVLTGEELTLHEIDALNRFGEGKAHLAYGQSYLGMKYLLDEYGWDSFLLFISELRRHNQLDPAFMAAVGLDYAGFQDEYAAFLRTKYNWATLLSDTMLFWIVIVLLLLLLYLFKRRHVKKKVEEWERATPTDDIFYPAGERKDQEYPGVGQQ
jgi:uncharacterized membrane protein